MSNSRIQLSALEDQQRGRLERLPPSAKLAYLALACEGRLTQGDLASETMLSPRTVRYALKRLKEEGLVTSDIYIPDARKNVYRVNLEE
ncbi:winged helix-turn-helix domain-containing protein [Halorientalis pallida]|uniref:ArsR family transcriptional regulator n=1 Tax=Halorientalis pallida TaxID=2479928 RepID=A0A498L4H8_9EURY|nr:winged helix-turn-helix domain-containing protein [Halorientalis pallida]RXK51162.1 ArsR family transcriptional regulator [Halorientalis pallida]